MQQRIILFVAVCAFFVARSEAQDSGSALYSRRYEKLDIDTILASPRLVTNYVDCLLNKKPCPPEGKALKRILPEALRTKCGRCWPSQKEGALKVITKLYFDYPQHYNALRKRWDPTGEYHRRFEEYLRDQKFNVINSNDDVLPSTTTSSTTSAPPSQAPAATFSRPLFQDNNVGGSTQEDNNVLIANRFGDEANEFDDPAIRAQPPRTPAPTPPPPPRTIAQATTRRNIVVRQYQQTQNPIVNIINRLSQKFTTTADFLAAMLRGGVMVQVGG